MRKVVEDKWDGNFVKKKTITEDRDKARPEIQFDFCQSDANAWRLN